MTTIAATSILASRHAQRPDIRLDSLLLRYPKCIHAELMTHRCFSRNAASSRAIPVEKMIQSVLDDPFIPLHWGANQKGMQAGEERHNDVMLGRPYHVPESFVVPPPGGVGWKEYPVAPSVAWQEARDYAIKFARAFANAGYHKQIVNRLLEPFSHITVLVSSTNWSNFLALRDHPDAEPHMQLLAKEIRKALDGASVQTLQPGEWHLPFVTEAEIVSACRHATRMRARLRDLVDCEIESLIKLSVARCASTSYKTVDGFDMSLERAIEIHDKLVSSKPMHASPLEHVCQADNWVERVIIGRSNWAHPEQHGNFVGFRQYRKMLPGESQ
jgi:hypothetical protein